MSDTTTGDEPAGHISRKETRKQQVESLKQMDQKEKELLIYEHFPKVKNGTYPKIMFDTPLQDLMDIKKTIIRKYKFTNSEIN